MLLRHNYRWIVFVPGHRRIFVIVGGENQLVLLRITIIDLPPCRTLDA